MGQKLLCCVKNDPVLPESSSDDDLDIAGDSVRPYSSSDDESDIERNAGELDSVSEEEMESEGYVANVVILQNLILLLRNHMLLLRVIEMSLKWRLRHQPHWYAHVMSLKSVSPKIARAFFKHCKVPLCAQFPSQKEIALQKKTARKNLNTTVHYVAMVLVLNAKRRNIIGDTNGDGGDCDHESAEMVSEVTEQRPNADANDDVDKPSSIADRHGR